MSNPSDFNIDEDEEFEYETPFKRKSKEVAEQFKIFGKQPFSTEQIEKARGAVGYPIQEFVSHLGGSIGDLAQFTRKILGIKEDKFRFPTTKDIKEQFKERETFAPQEFEPNELTKRIGQGAGIAGSFLGLPFPGMRLGQLGAAAIGTPVVGATAKTLGAPDWAQAGLENLFLIGSSLKGLKGLETTKNQMYKQANRLLPQGASTNTTRLNKWATLLKDKLKLRGHDPETAQVLQKLEDIIEASSSGNTSIALLDALKRSVHSLIKNPETLKGTRKLLMPISKNLNRNIYKYGKTNPKWLKSYSSADQLESGLQNSAKISRFVKSKANPKNPLTWLVFGVKKGIGALGAGKAVEVMHRIATNKQMRRYYANAVKHSIKGNAKAMNYYVNKLDKGISSLEKKDLPLEDEEFEYSYPK